jgi:hypothetical protein
VRRLKFDDYFAGRRADEVQSSHGTDPIWVPAGRAFPERLGEMVSIAACRCGRRRRPTLSRAKQRHDATRSSGKSCSFGPDPLPIKRPHYFGPFVNDSAGEGDRHGLRAADGWRVTPRWGAGECGLACQDLRQGRGNF